MSDRRESDARYNRSAKGRARHARYNNSPKGSDRAWKWYCSLTLQQRFERYMQQRQKRTAENQAMRRAVGFVPNSAVVAKLDKLIAVEGES